MKTEEERDTADNMSGNRVNATQFIHRDEGIFANQIEGKDSNGDATYVPTFVCA